MRKPYKIQSNFVFLFTAEGWGKGNLSRWIPDLHFMWGHYVKGVSLYWGPLALSFELCL